MTEQNKTEKPTPHKLKEAKKKGQVAKSIELNNLVTFILFGIAFFVFYESIVYFFTDITQKILLSSSSLVF